MSYKGFTKEMWYERISYRSDLSSQVVHLTKEAEIDGKPYTALDVLIKILREECINGTVCYYGNRKAACFQDVPLNSVAQNLKFEKRYREVNEINTIRYRPYGLMFSKPYVYEKGGRPVIYDYKNEAKKYLPENEWWRIVNLDLTGETYIDWTHEREWRVPDRFLFSRKCATILVENPNQFKKFFETCPPEIISQVCTVLDLTTIML